MIIDETGTPQVWKAVYARYHSRYEEECDSLKEARAFLRNGEEYGELSSIHIVSPEGEIIEYDYVTDNDDDEEADTPVTTAASEHQNTTTEADKNAPAAPAAQLEGSDGK